MDSQEFRKHAHELVDWMADYIENTEQYPVKSQVKPNEIYDSLPDQAPEKGEPMPEILSDFHQHIMPGLTHWQSPNFFAYYPSNTSYPSIMAEMISAALGTQGMIWDTSPAATELEQKVTDWLKPVLGLPNDWSGVIHHGASMSTLTSILCAREQHSGFKINEEGFEGFTNFKVYCSKETHSSVEKSVKIGGFGKSNLSTIETDEVGAMKAAELRKTIEADIKNGMKPICVIAAIGTTGTTAIDPLEEIAAICKEHNIWLHVDAAYAGTALVLPEYRWMIKGIEHADSFVFNPHKWMFTNFDCSVYFVKDKKALTDTFEILPEYLKTQSKGVTDYRDWGVPLGRRFRSLKLWFVIRNMGVEGIRSRIRTHIELAQQFVGWIEDHPDFEMIVPLSLNNICFRYAPDHIKSEEELNLQNEALLHAINKTGKIYLTHTKVHGKYTLRIVVAHTRVTENHIKKAWELIQQLAD
jgi:aromatic-L-amino-acid decarboxylase